MQQILRVVDFTTGRNLSGCFQTLSHHLQVSHHACFHFWSDKNVSSELHSACQLKGFFFKINLPSLYIAHDYLHVRVEEEVVKY